MKCKELYLKKRDGKTIFAKLYLPDYDKKYPLALFAHGFGSDLSNLEHYGPMFVEYGIGMLLFDFCGGGPRSKSDGVMTEMSVLTELEDLLFVFDEISRLEYIDMDNIFLMGESQGGYVAAHCASVIPDKIKGLILWYPAFVLEENAENAFVAGEAVDSKLFGLDIGAIYSRDAVTVDIYSRIGAYKKDVLIIHGDEDYVVPLEASKKALSIYENAGISVLPGAGHGFNGDDIQKAARECIDFINSHI